MIDWFKVADEIKNSEYPKGSTAHTAQVFSGATNEEILDINSNDGGFDNIVSFPVSKRYYPTVERTTALRLLDELAMNPPVMFTDWAEACVAKGLSENTGKLRAIVACDLVKMGRLNINDDGEVLL